MQVYSHSYMHVSEHWLSLLYSCMDDILHTLKWLLLYYFVLYGRTRRTEINFTALQAVGIMRLFHWLEFNWEATLGRGREERLLKSLSAVRLPLTLLKSSSESASHSFAFFCSISCSLAASVRLPFLSLCLLSLSLVLSVFGQNRIKPSLFSAMSLTEHPACWRWSSWMITKPHSTGCNPTHAIYNLIQPTSLSESPNLLWDAHTRTKQEFYFTHIWSDHWSKLVNW